MSQLCVKHGCCLRSCFNYRCTPSIFGSSRLVSLQYIWFITLPPHKPWLRPSQPLWLGLRILEAKATGFHAKPSQNITRRPSLKPKTIRTLARTAVSCSRNHSGHLRWLVNLIYVLYDHKCSLPACAMYWMVRPSPYTVRWWENNFI
jgi:hypothetical protein